jgi:alpha-galactosidase
MSNAVHRAVNPSTARLGHRGREFIVKRFHIALSITVVCWFVGRPLTDAASGEEALILTPKPPATPRINGPRLFGVRPGHPLLFTIPATGDRPMEFAVDDLPAGLKVDPQTGQITGSLSKAGEYSVTFRAKNALGDAERKFKIVCGDTLALTPPMGWNDWYVWGRNVTDKIIRDAADAMVSSGMIQHGWTYVGIDDCWMVKPDSKDPMLGGPPRDAQGNINTNKRFPDMKGLTDYIHGKGLKAGLYTAEGRLTCCGHEGVYEHEEQDARQFARWGFDYLKLDSCSPYPGKQEPYCLMGKTLKTLDRDIILGIVRPPADAESISRWTAAGVHSWRTAKDLAGLLDYILDDGFGLYGQNQLQKFSGPGHWNDPDYLSLGYLRDQGGGGVRKDSVCKTWLSPNEQYSYVSLWCLLSAPLFFSGDVTRLDAFTLSLLTNDEVLEVDQDPLGRAALRVAKADKIEIWAKDMEDGSKAVGLFNLGKSEAVATVKWSDLGISGKQNVRDLWRQKDLGPFEGQFSATVGRHGVVLVRIRPQR